MSTLVYFSSGSIKPEYAKLPFDEIYLIDFWSFRNKSKRIITDSGNDKFEPLQIGKITCISMECLNAIDYLKSKKVKADYFVSINEGCYSHVKRCALGSYFFFGYMMPALADNYVYITNLKKYYGDMDKASMGLPYDAVPLCEGDDCYIDPKIFANNADDGVDIFQMKKINETVELDIDSPVKVSVVRDSIWNYYDKLDLIVSSISDFERKRFFDRMPKVITWNHITESKRVYCLYSLSENVWKSKFEIGKNLDKIFDYCVQNKINKIGFTPWGNGNYNTFIEKIQNYKETYPKEIILFHLIKDNYKELTTKYNKKIS
ncbi:MAG: hypothetical protein LBP59_19875 [Planctomycetaceae bacterium]|jgi:hypothetical protein|nr:hypothetical protein [Planctomycetaceae bacterium]